MNVKKKLWLSLAFVLMAGVFNMLCFWLVKEYTTSFYISIAFINGSILVLAFSMFLMAKKGKYIYLSFQDGFVISGYSIVCVILNLCFALSKMDNITANIMVNFIILAIYLIFLFVIFSNTAAITAQLEQDRKERNAYYNLKDKCEQLLGKGNSLMINKRIESMYDKITSCQINRTVDVSNIDNQILLELADLEIELTNKNAEDIVLNKVMNVIGLIEDRNRQIVNKMKR